MLCPEEAIGRCGGDRSLLEQGVKDGYIVKSCRGGMPMYYFPRYAYSRETLFTQKVLGEQGQPGGKESDLDLIVADWNPASIIPEGLEKAGHGMLVGALGGTSSSMAPLALPSSSASSGL